MNIQLKIDAVRQLYGAADSVHDFDHVLRVLRLAERIARVEGADWAVVRTATLLHDWGRAEADACNENHAQIAAVRAREFLAAQGAQTAWIEVVAHAIAAHRFRAEPDPETLEAQVLFDADKLDAIGAVGIARAFAFGGAHNQRLWAARDEIDRTQWDARGDDPANHTPVHEFVVKLSRIKERLYTPEARAIASERHRFMVAFYGRLDAEVRGQI